MSKIGVKPIIIKEGVTVQKEGGNILAKGPLGEVKVVVPANIKVEIEDGQIRVTRLKEDKKTRSCHGTIARLITNAIIGTSSGFEKNLEVVGTGFRGQMEGEVLVLTLGFSHPVRFDPPTGIKISMVENKIKVAGANKEVVGLIAARIKKIKEPDAYKGKGIHYEGEKLKLKPGKVVAKAGVAGGTGGK